MKVVILGEDGSVYTVLPLDDFASIETDTKEAD
jgi:hypothetical protein